MKSHATLTLFSAAALLTGVLLLFAGCEKEKVKEYIHTIVTDTNTTTTENSIVGTWVACGYTSKSMNIPNCFDAWYPEDGLRDTLVFFANDTISDNWRKNHHMTYKLSNDSTLLLKDETTQYSEKLHVRFLNAGNEMVIFRFRQYGIAAVMSNTRFHKINSEKNCQWACITDDYSIKINVSDDNKLFCEVMNESPAQFFFQDKKYYKYTTYSSTASKSDTLYSITHQWNEKGDTEKVANEIYRIHKLNEESVLVEYAGFAPDIPCKDCIYSFIFKKK